MRRWRVAAVANLWIGHATNFPFTRSITAPISASDRQQIGHQVELLLLGQIKPEKAIVMIDDIVQSREPPVVKKSSFLMCPESAQGRGPILPVGCAICLKVVDPDLARGVHIPTRLGEEGG